jgi:endoglucanase
MSVRKNAYVIIAACAWLAIGGCRRDASAHSAAETATAAGRGAAGAHALSPFIVVDQFGYLPADAKVAVVRKPKFGYDSGSAFEPGTSYQVRRAADDAVVFSGNLAAWNAGAVQPSSGDSGWWFDFSAVDAPGAYFVLDVQRNVRSAVFSIDANVYKKVLKAAMRTYFYQRSAFEKKPPFAEACWTDTAAYIGKNQDTAAHDVTDRDNGAKVRDMSGGWFDAGDTNKYVTFAAQPVHQLLTAFEANPAAFTDDFNIPESGNGIPDLIDEVKWETDWLKKMQFPDDSVALKLGDLTFATASPPSSDHSERFYVPSCSSATIAAAGIFAHASYVYGKIPALAADAADLKRRAIGAWKNYQRVPVKQTQCDKQVVLAGNADWSLEEQNAHAVEAAIYLLAITSDPGYGDYVAAHYRETRPYHDFGWSRYVPDQGESLLFFTRLPMAKPALKAAVLADKQHDAVSGNQVYGFVPNDDLYRAFMHDAQYHWGSNNPRANYGNTNLDAIAYEVNPKASASYRMRALEVLHYFHGVNPFGMVYLSNMYAEGATSSANEIFHLWFASKSKWSDAKTSECGPAPGFVPGGANVNAAANGVPTTLVPPTGQPAQKSYRDWNGNWPEVSWAVTEPGIYYQAAYIRLLSAFVH